MFVERMNDLEIHLTPWVLFELKKIVRVLILQRAGYIIQEVTQELKSLLGL